MGQFPEMPATDFDEMPAPPDDLIGSFVYVREDTGRAGFMAYGRKNINGDPEWYINGDQIQVHLTGNANWTNLGAGPTAATNGGLIAVDLTDYTEVRFTGNVAVVGATGDALLRYTTDNFGSTAVLTSNTVDLSVSGFFATDWEPVPTGARSPVTITVYGINGDGAEDPRIYSAVAHFRR